MSTRREFLGGAAAMTLTSSLPGHSSQQRNTLEDELWYAQEAKIWMEALPLGNGNQGAMVFGGVKEERIALSDSTAWSGAPGNEETNPEAQGHLDEIRRLIFARKYTEATKVSRNYLPGRARNFGTNLPLPDLLITFEDVPGPITGYRRVLALDTATASVSYKVGRQAYRREAFASHAHRLLAYRIAHPASFRMSFGSTKLPVEVHADKSRFILRGRAVETKHSDGKSGVDFEIHVSVVEEGGRLTHSHDAIEVSGTSSATILIAIATSFQGKDPALECQRILDAASHTSYQRLRDAHVADYAPLFRRVSFSLGDDSRRDMSTDARLRAVARGTSDPSLHALFMQYGRYLTIAGSRGDSVLPLALQGIWNDGLAAAMGWTDDFHLDINTEQNYWAAEICNLPESQAPLFRFLERLRVAGQRTAKEMYGAKGWVVHTITNPWGYTAPGEVGWGIFPTAGVWISLQLWEHYLFTRDEHFLKTIAFPVLSGAAEFFLSYMVSEPTHHWLVTGPSESPENAFRDPAGGNASESMMPTIDRVMVFALLSICEQACTVMKSEQDLVDRVRVAKAKLPPLQVGRHGQLQEWLFDFEDAYPNHRHTSHLTALYPEWQVDVRLTPELARAAEITIERRIAARDWEQTEWGRGNFMAYYARLLNGDRAAHYLEDLLSHATGDNLLTFSQGGVAGALENIFAIDGNTAAAAAIAEMLLQSHRGELELLPALPAEWKNGAISGLCARGGHTVDIVWKNGRLVSASIHSRFDGMVSLRYRSIVKELRAARGGVLHVVAADFS